MTVHPLTVDELGKVPLDKDEYTIAELSALDAEVEELVLPNCFVEYQRAGEDYGSTSHWVARNNDSSEFIRLVPRYTRDVTKAMDAMRARNVILYSVGNDFYAQVYGRGSSDFDGAEMVGGHGRFLKAKTPEMAVCIALLTDSRQTRRVLMQLERMRRL